MNFVKTPDVCYSHVLGRKNRAENTTGKTLPLTGSLATLERCTFLLGIKLDSLLLEVGIQSALQELRDG